MDTIKEQTINIEELVNIFLDETEKYSKKIIGLAGYNIETFYINKKKEKEINSIDAKYDFKDFTLKIEYKLNYNILVPKSTLEIRFMFNQGLLPVEYSIYDLFQIIDVKDFKCYTIPYIVTLEEMKQAVKYLIQTFNRYRKRIEKLAQDKEKINILENNIKKNVQTLLKEDVFKSRDPFYMGKMLELFYAIDISKFTNGAYILYLRKDYSKAIKKYKKNRKNLTTYEISLMNYLENEEDKTSMIMPNNLQMILKVKNSKNSFTDLVSLYLSWILLTPIYYAMYFLLFFIVRKILISNSEYFAGLDSFYLLFFSFLTAIVSSFFAMKYMYKVVFNKKYKTNMELLEFLQNQRFGRKIMTKLLQFIIALSLVVTVLLSNTGIILYKDYFKDTSNIFDIKGKSYAYTDIKYIEKTKKKELGIEYEDYVILLKDESKIKLNNVVEDNMELEKLVNKFIEKGTVIIIKN